MKLQRQKSERQRQGLGNSSIGKAEKEFNAFIQHFINSREAVESYIRAAKDEGKTRRQAIAELHSFGIFLQRLPE